MTENYLKNAEMALEDDYDSIDGIINNGSKSNEYDKLRNTSESIPGNTPLQRRQIKLNADAISRTEQNNDDLNKSKSNSQEL